MQEVRFFLAETPMDGDLMHLASMIEPCTATPARPTVPLWVDHFTLACQHCEAGFHFEEGGCFGFAMALYEELSKIQPSAKIGLSAASQGFSHCVVLLGPLAFDHQGDLPLEKNFQYTPVQCSQDHSGVYAAALACGRSRDDVDGDAHWARNVISSAKSICLSARLNADFPLVLKDADAISDHLEKTTPGGIDTEMVRELFFGSQAVLVRIPTAFVEEDTVHADNHAAVAKRQTRYNKMPADTSPPILIGEDGNIQDGHHRKRASVARNDPWMLAYQVIDAQIDLGLCPEKHSKMNHS